MLNCASCENLFCEDQLVSINGELFCADCAKELGYVQCRDCGEWFELTDDTVMYDGEPLCESCESNYGTCEDCDEVFPLDDLVEVHGAWWQSSRYVCEDCVMDYCQCAECGEWFREAAGNTDEDGTFVCNDCQENYGLYICEDCGLWTSEPCFTDDDEVYCDSCYEHHQRDDCFSTHVDDCGDVDHGEAIHRYGFKPAPSFRNRTNDSDIERKFNIGTEVEVDSNDWSMGSKAEPTALAIKDVTDFVYMKSDGSLQTGFEIVSHPATIGYHMYNAPWKAIFSKCVKAGFRSHQTNTCGLHIHVSRAGLGDNSEEINRTIRKVIVLVNRYWEEITRFTRRTESQLSSWAERNHIRDYRLDAVINDNWAEQRIRIANTHNDRYNAINCENEATIEFRVFKGTLKRDTFIASLQFVWNICHYAMTHDWDEIQHGQWLDMAHYKHWNELDAYLAVRGLAPACPPVYNSTHTPDFTGPDGITD